MLSEAEGRAVLRKVFEGRGFSITENVDFAEGEVSFNIDGWDAAARVGYEYLTHEAGDFDDLSPEELEELATRMEAGELFIFLVDELYVGSAEELAWAAEAFLDFVERRRPKPRR